MRLLYTLSAALAATELATAAPAPQSRQTSNACGRISTGKQSRVPASLALECLRSVPNKQQPALKLLASLKSYVSWQSTLTWLKNPPKSYLFPAVDVLGQLDNIAAKVGKGGYASEYDFQLELYKLVISAHDGHFSFTGDVFRPFNFQNDLAARIVSVSMDGVAVPRLYPYSAFGPGAKGDPVAITEINGVNATDFVTKQNVEFSSFQDPDSQWNSMFPSVVKPQSFLTVASSVAYQGDSVTLTFANGTKQTEQSYAALYADFSNIRNGDDFYTKFCSGKTAAGSMRLAEPATPAEEMKKRDAAGFPAPVIADPEGAISGYFLSGKGYDDVAVLLVKSFSTTGTQPVKFLNDFQKTISTFLQMCRTQGKKRLVIDLSGNGGGYVVAGYELFAQIFPELKEFGSTNVRRTESFVTIAKIIGSLPSDFSPSSMAQQNSIQTLSQSTIMTNLIPGGVERPDGTSFATIDEILEPVTLHDDDFTAYQFTPLASALPGFNLTGSPGQPKPPAAVFKSENVMLLTDGTCGSTCTIFSYLMTVQASVKSTAIGGRPMTGPMQSIAGVEGAQIFLFSDIKKTADAAIGLVNDDNMQDTLRGGDLGVLAEGYALTRASDPNNAGGVNGKNNFLPRDSSTPAQFLYQPANCRFFYTAPMLGDASLVWQRAVDSSWNDPAKFCVQGSRVSVNTSANMADVGFDGADDAGTIIANLGSADSKQQHQEGAAVSWRNASTSGLAILVGVLTVLLSQL